MSGKRNCPQKLYSEIGQQIFWLRDKTFVTRFPRKKLSPKTCKNWGQQSDPDLLPGLQAFLATRRPVMNSTCIKGFWTVNGKCCEPERRHTLFRDNTDAFGLHAFATPPFPFGRSQSERKLCTHQHFAAIIRSWIHFNFSSQVWSADFKSPAVQPAEWFDSTFRAFCSDNF